MLVCPFLLENAENALFSRAKAAFDTQPETPENTRKMPLAVVSDNRS